MTTATQRRRKAARKKAQAGSASSPPLTLASILGVSRSRKAPKAKPASARASVPIPNPKVYDFPEQPHIRDPFARALADAEAERARSNSLSARVKFLESLLEV